MPGSARCLTQISKSFRTALHFPEFIKGPAIDIAAEITMSHAVIHDCFPNAPYSTPDRRGLYDEA
jgi:hypothetical protein